MKVKELNFQNSQFHRILKSEFHFVYMTKCDITGMIYIGKHTTTNLNDGYQGSGTHLGLAIRKYGKENFTTIPIFFSETSDDAFDLESTIVDDEFVKSTMTYNLKTGGKSGNLSSDVKKRMFTPERNKAISIKLKQNYNSGLSSVKGENNPRFGDNRNYIELYGEDKAKLLKQEQSISRSGEGNSRAIKWRFTSPTNIVYDVHGKCKEFCINNNLMISRLKKYLGSSVPSETKQKSRLISSERFSATIGWKLEKL